MKKCLGFCDFSPTSPAQNPISLENEDLQHLSRCDEKEPPPIEIEKKSSLIEKEQSHTTQLEDEYEVIYKDGAIITEEMDPNSDVIKTIQKGGKIILGKKINKRAQVLSPIVGWCWTVYKNEPVVQEVILMAAVIFPNSYAESIGDEHDIGTKCNNKNLMNGIGLIKASYDDRKRLTYGTGTIFYQNRNQFYVVTSCSSICMLSRGKIVPPSKIYFRQYDVDLNLSSKYGDSAITNQYTVDNYWIHPGYRNSPSGDEGFDIAILEISKRETDQQMDSKQLIGKQDCETMLRRGMNITGFPLKQKGEIWNIDMSILGGTLDCYDFDNIYYYGNIGLMTDIYGGAITIDNGSKLCGVHSGFDIVNADNYGTVFNASIIQWIQSIVDGIDFLATVVQYS